MRRAALLLISLAALLVCPDNAGRIVRAQCEPALSYVEKVQSYSPFAYWTLSELSGATAYDSSGGAHHGSYSGVTLAGDTFPDGAAAPIFDGVNDYVNIYSNGLQTAWNAAALDGGTAIVWVKVNSSFWTDGTLRYILGVRSSSSSAIRLYKSSANAFTWLVESTSGTQFHGAGFGTPTTWTMAAITWSQSANQARYFAGGTLISTDGAIGALHSNLNSTLNAIGASGTAAGNPLFGAIAHVALFGDVLSDSAIADLAVVPVGATPTPCPTSTPTATPGLSYVFTLEPVATGQPGQPVEMQYEMTLNGMVSGVLLFAVWVTILIGIVIYLLQRKKPA